MSRQASTALKRKRGEEHDSLDSPTRGSSTDNSVTALVSTIPGGATQTLIERKGLAKAEFAEASVLASCRAAAVHSPAAARSVLARHRTSIDPELIKILEIVGGYEKEVSTASRETSNPHHCTLP